MKFVNLTPHDVVVRIHGSEIVFPSHTPPARVSQLSTVEDHIDIIPIARVAYGQVEGLPPPDPGTMYIVSLIVLQALRGSRLDVVAPGTGPSDGAIRDERGQVVAVTRLVQFAPQCDERTGVSRIRCELELGHAGPHRARL